MGMDSSKTPGRKKRSRSSKAAKDSKEPGDPISGHREAVEELLKRFSKALKSEKEVTLTVNEYIRLLQLYKELMQQAPREIEVRWVEGRDCKESGET
jgi:hypothetical protein